MFDKFLKADDPNKEEIGAAINAMVQKIADDCPPEIAATLTDDPIGSLVVAVESTSAQTLKALAMAQRLHDRCGVCRDGKDCAHCVSDGLVLKEITEEAFKLAVMMRVLAPTLKKLATRKGE